MNTIIGITIRGNILWRYIISKVCIKLMASFWVAKLGYDPIKKSLGIHGHQGFHYRLEKSYSYSICHLQDLKWFHPSSFHPP